MLQFSHIFQNVYMYIAHYKLLTPITYEHISIHAY